MITSPHSAGVVADGQERAHRAAEPKVREEVEREYAQRLAAAGWLRRLVLKRQMESEIEERLEKIAPHDALYLRE